MRQHDFAEKVNGIFLFHDLMESVVLRLERSVTAANLQLQKLLSEHTQVEWRMLQRFTHHLSNQVRELNQLVWKTEGDSTDKLRKVIQASHVFRGMLRELNGLIQGMHAAPVEDEVLRDLEQSKKTLQELLELVHE